MKVWRYISNKRFEEQIQRTLKPLKSICKANMFNYSLKRRNYQNHHEDEIRGRVEKR